MIVKVLASGSKGNSTYIQTNELKILIDMGTTFQYLANELAKINITPKELEYILITHTHSDHIKGLSSLVHKTNIQVLATKGMIEELSKKIPLENINIIPDKFTLGDIKVKLIHNSHDVESVGYIIENNNKSLVYITDTGYINKKYLSLLANRNLYILESNHDEKMLMDGPYPFMLKQRVIGDKGHLSNHTTGKVLSEVVGDNTQKIILAHLSEKNNTEELAYNTVKDILDVNDIHIELEVAKQYESLDIVEV